MVGTSPGEDEDEVRRKLGFTVQVSIEQYLLSNMEDWFGKTVIACSVQRDDGQLACMRTHTLIPSTSVVLLPSTPQGAECSLAQPIITHGNAVRFGIYGFFCAVKAAYALGSRDGQAKLLIVPKHTGADSESAELRFRVPVKFDKIKSEYRFEAQPNKKPSSRIPNWKALLELPDERGVWINGEWHGQASCTVQLTCAFRSPMLRVVC